MACSCLQVELLYYAQAHNISCESNLCCQYPWHTCSLPALQHLASLTAARPHASGAITKHDCSPRTRLPNHLAFAFAFLIRKFCVVMRAHRVAVSHQEELLSLARLATALEIWVSIAKESRHMDYKVLGLTRTRLCHRALSRLRRLVGRKNASERLVLAVQHWRCALVWAGWRAYCSLYERYHRLLSPLRRRHRQSSIEVQTPNRFCQPTSVCTEHFCSHGYGPPPRNERRAHTRVR